MVRYQNAHYLITVILRQNKVISLFVMFAAYTIEGEAKNAVGVMETNDKLEVEGADKKDAVAVVEPTPLEKFWKAVRDNPSDFTGWTYLLQYVEQQVGRPCCQHVRLFLVPGHVVESFQHTMTIINLSSGKLIFNILFARIEHLKFLEILIAFRHETLPLHCN